MASIVCCLISIMLLYIRAPQGRKTPYTTTNNSTTSHVINDGVCKTMVETQGYTCEEHKVTTEDGYILSLQRIPAKRSGKKADKSPVLIQHGIFFDGVVWLLNSPQESLGFILADGGFDVWIVNGRGTKYSTMHTSLSPNDKGSLMAFVALSQGKLLNMMKSAALLSPIAHMNLIRSDEIRFAAYKFLADVVSRLGIYKFIPNMYFTCY
ncbi:hypothetical protein TSUD_137080 [Trifolium subterraneum]|uniref:Partial AB-hydrolase lipase domain-containing protein n=1 Tax=Trifolium subterraneum TaxID=3900 RepID=A0A2Z6PBI3_TRISU|nr:hypothetical protein TSUD_137080 [Trifolium subterraneum]